MDKTIFAQVLELVPRRRLKSLSKREEQRHGNCKLSAWEQFICMSFAQLTHCNGLRDIETCFRAMSHKTYHLGMHSNVSKSQLSRINNQRPSIIFSTLAKMLIKEARALYRNDRFDKEMNEVVYALDSTYISLCLSMFP